MFTSLNLRTGRWEPDPKDLADSKRINTNIKAAAAAEQSRHGLDPVSQADDAGYCTPPATVGLTDSHSPATFTQSLGSQNGEIANVGVDKKLPLDVLEATIISSLFWPPFQVVSLYFRVLLLFFKACIRYLKFMSLGAALLEMKYGY